MQQQQQQERELEREHEQEHKEATTMLSRPPHHHQHQPLLYVIAVHSNPMRFRRRAQLYLEFCHRMEKHAQEHPMCLVRVETVYGRDSHFEVTHSDTPLHIQFRSGSPIWHKESMVQAAMCHLPHGWKYVAWVDADVEFLNPQWVEDTLLQLQTNHLVQMWQSAIDLGPDHQTLHVHHSFADQYVQTVSETEFRKKVTRCYSSLHPGYSWACTRTFIEKCGLYVAGILGSGDRHMAYAAVGCVEHSHHKDVHTDYKTSLKSYEDRVVRLLRGHLGCTRGTLLHHWHGRKQLRGYQDRWKILVEHKFSPLTHLRVDPITNLVALDYHNSDLACAVERYFASRNEDSIDLS